MAEFCLKLWRHLLRSATNLRRSSGIVSSQRGFVISTERKGINDPLISLLTADSRGILHRCSKKGMNSDGSQ